MTSANEFANPLLRRDFFRNQSQSYDSILFHEFLACKDAPNFKKTHDEIGDKTSTFVLGAFLAK